MGISEMKRYETDNAIGDGNIQKKHFPELKNNVSIPTSIDTDLVYASIKNNDFIYITNKNAVNN